MKNDYIEFLEDFAKDIISLWNKFVLEEHYFPEDLEQDFYCVMEKWKKRIEHYLVIDQEEGDEKNENNY